MTIGVSGHILENHILPLLRRSDDLVDHVHSFDDLAEDGITETVRIGPVKAIVIDYIDEEL